MICFCSFTANKGDFECFIVGQATPICHCFAVVHMYLQNKMEWFFTKFIQNTININKPLSSNFLKSEDKLKVYDELEIIEV